MKISILAFGFVLCALAQDGSAPGKLAAMSQEESTPAKSLLEAQLKAANSRIADLEERVALLTKQQQGVIQYLQAGQALCEMDKKRASELEKTGLK